MIHIYYCRKFQESKETDSIKNGKIKPAEAEKVLVPSVG